MFELVRVITVRTAKMHPDIRTVSIDYATAKLEVVMKDIVKYCEDLEKKRKEREREIPETDLTKLS
jgi:hypothetical protein